MLVSVIPVLGLPTTVLFTASLCNCTSRKKETMSGPARRSIDDVLSQARSRLIRLTAWEAYRAQQAGAVLVDIRPQASLSLIHI